MQSLISVNRKFMDVDPKKLVQLILKSKYTKGIELYVNYNSSFELKYLKDLVFEIKNNNLILQIHGDSNLPIEKQIDFLKLLENYSKSLGYQIVVTLHSIYDDDKKISLKKTIDYFSNLINEIDTNRLTICLENLNDISNFDRLEKEYITPIILNDEKLYFTYDIGHEFVDYGNITNLNEYMIDEIRNIHLHTNDGKGSDHKPIYKNDKNWNKIIKSLLYLDNIKYKYNIVYEYNINDCYGESIEEKIIDYLNSIDFVSSHY